MINKSKILAKYYNGDINANIMLGYLQDGDYYNAYYAQKMLEINRMDPKQREIAFKLVLTDSTQSLSFITHSETNKIASKEEISTAFKIVCKDYCSLKKLFDSFNYSVKFISKEDLSEMIKNLDRNKALTNTFYNDLILEIGKTIKYLRLSIYNEIIDACSQNLDLFESCIDLKSFDENLEYAYDLSNYYFEKKAKLSMQKCLDYCCYFEQFINSYHLEFLVKRIQGKKQFGIAKDLIDKKYTFNKFTSNQIERLESMVIMKELQGGL